MQIVRLCQRNDIESNWKLSNPILLVGEMAVSTDINNFKVGDGKTAWKDLPYYMQSLTDDEILALCK